jgi:hypothetical protein
LAALDLVGGGLAKDEHVLVADEMRALAAIERPLDLHPLPERRARDQLAVADRRWTSWPRTCGTGVGVRFPRAGC